MDLLAPIDFMAVGHICYDVVGEGKVIGGAAAYTTGVAAALGCRTAVLTSSNPQDDWSRDFPGTSILNIPANETTLFENIYGEDGRRQIIHARAGELEAKHLPSTWQRASMVHFGPIANEVDEEMVGLFSNSMVGLSPQGWMRQWDDNGMVSTGPWEGAEHVLPLAAATFLSKEDLNDPSDLDRYIELAPLLVLTNAEAGCTVYSQGESRTFPGRKVEAVETTGAGDIFAAAYMIRLRQTAGDPWEAAQFANRVAAESVTATGLHNKIAAIEQAVALFPG